MSFITDNLLGILIACIVVLIIYKIKRTFNYFIERDLPFIKPSWNDIKRSLSFTAFIYLPLEMYNRSKDTDSPYIGYFMTLFKPAILVKDPSLAESILIKDFSYFQDHGFDIDFDTNPLARHLFNMKGDQWRTLRHKLVPTFTSGKLRGMVPIMEECADKIIEDINRIPSLKNETNLKDLYKQYSLSVIASCAFGIDPEGIKDPNCQFRKVIQEVVTPTFFGRLRFSLFFVLPRLTKFLKIKFFAQNAEDFMLSLTKQTLEMRKKSGIKRNDFIQLILELKEKGSVDLDIKELEQDEKDTLANIEKDSTQTKLELTDELLMAQVFVFLVGGFENVAYLVAINQYLLAKYPEIQSRVREEVKQMKAKHGRIDYQALRDMTLLGACIDESLRLHPPVFSMLRESNKPYTFSDGKKIEKGVAVLLPALSFHMDSKYWTNPEKYDPDRFLNGEGIRPGIYMPFGDGPRICIAQRLALITVKIILAKLLLNFELKSSPKTKEPIKLQVFFGADNLGGFWGTFQDLKA